MAEIKSIGLIICILMVLMAYLKQAIPRGKTTYLMKAIISIQRNCPRYCIEN